MNEEPQRTLNAGVTWYAEQYHKYSKTKKKGSDIHYKTLEEFYAASLSPELVQQVRMRFDELQ